MVYIKDGIITPLPDIEAEFICSGKEMKRILYYLIQWTWGLPQNLAGLLLRLVYKNDYKPGERPDSDPDEENQGPELYKGAVITHWKKSTSMSMGMFLFLGYGAGPRLIKHEYGHTIQSLILGPFYLPVIGVPSFLWCNVPGCGMSWRNGKVSYFSIWHERWADRCGFCNDTDDSRQMQA